LENQNLKIACEGADRLSINIMQELKSQIKNLSLKGFDHLKQSLLKYGFSAPIFIWQHDGINYILDGCQRLKVLQGMQQEGFQIPSLPVDYIEAETEKEAKEKRLHITGQYGKFSLKGLEDLLEEAGIGFMDIADSVMIDGIEKILHPDSTDGDDEYQEEIPSISNSENLWELGRHRLFCGSSTNRKASRHLMDNKTAQMIFTDPPYGVSYSGDNNPNGRHWDVIKGDDFRGTRLKNLIRQSFKNAFAYMVNDCAVYVCYASSQHIVFEEALREAGFRIRQQLIWSKQLVLGHSDYHWSHEPILYCSKEKKSRWYGDRTSKTMILNSDFEELTKMKKEQLLDIILQLKAHATVFEITKDAASEYVHPTQKPVDLSMKAIINSSAQRGIIVDLFSGSGSTLIACEKTNRTFFGFEIDPHYCDIIVNRYAVWCKRNGKEIIIKRNKNKWQSKVENQNL